MRVVCIKDGFMDAFGDYRQFAVTGKEYEVLNVKDTVTVIKSELGEHVFDHDELHTWFKFLPFSFAEKLELAKKALKPGEEIIAASILLSDSLDILVVKKKVVIQFGETYTTYIRHWFNPETKEYFWGRYFNNVREAMACFTETISKGMGGIENEY